MSGHSKWATIKRAKGANDAARSRVFTKISRDITVAAANGIDPESNFLLRLAISRAKEANMSADKIQKAIERASGPAGDNMIEITYEALFLGNIALLIKCQTDNTNRTLTNLKQALAPAKLVPAGSVNWQFEEYGVVVLGGLDDAARMLAMDLDGVVDIITNPAAETDAVIVRKASYSDAVHKMEERKLRIVNNSLQMLPKSPLTIAPEKMQQLTEIINSLEEEPEVVEVWHNAQT